ncbi:MAG: Hint domain-containing protein [Paenirhodobacter sp.]|uniref:Hint domain-containing protein n=1 Tax=Paenirhodobacter sp. TaxID=1965326 RepID=UPI003D0C1C2E
MTVISGTNGSDTLTGTDCNDTICASGGDDVVNAKGGNDLVYGGTGDDYILGGKGNDTLYGDAGDDTLIAGDGFDKLYGGAGNDELHGGGDNDILSGGDDADTIYVDTVGSSCVNNTTVDGGSGGLDDDTLDISGLLEQGWEVVSVVKNPETNGAPGYNGQIQLYNPTTHQWANINFTDIEHVPCFTPGTMIATPTGEVAVEALRVGDRVMTRDNGIQEIRWIGRRDLSMAEVGTAAHLRPVMIAKGALGNGLPERDMMVSPNHRMLIANEKTSLYFEEHEVLVAAKHLVGRPGITRAAATDVSYVHFMCDRHEVVLADGAWSESFQPGDLTLGSLGKAQRDEIFAIFPELKTPVGREGYIAARRTLKKHEAALLRAG